MKKCSKCGEIKPLEEYHKDKRATDGRRSACAKCINTHCRKNILIGGV